MGQLHTAIAEFRNVSGRRTDVILVGDFNRHDTLWGGDEVTGKRQGEAGPIIELMREHGLYSLLPRGTKTLEGSGGRTSTIDLVLASTELADEMTSCGIHPIEHGSDHRAIRTEFDTTPLERTPGDRLLFKNAPWLEIKERVRSKLEALPCGRHSAGSDGQADVGGAGHDQRPGPTSQAVALRQEVVDDGPDPTAADVYILAQPSKGMPARGSRPGAKGQRSGKGVRRRDQEAEKGTLGQFSRRRSQHLLEIPGIPLPFRV
ncbi:hypothetical protein FOMA001_g20100 [Fusarium oxysporum f. sp. matthiolae]|nr:hypothetical protein FOMA001_g20100 [Fusarium oxysporum f. sp. matthiolae]